MKLYLVRFASAHDDTLGILYVDNQFECFTLEDEFRTAKVWAETRISSGTYPITLQTSGKLHKRYSNLYPNMHKGMLLLNNVPDFTGIMIHQGNKETHTAGCLLVGDELKTNKETRGFLGKSAHAYKRLYPRVVKALLNGEPVSIKITDYS